MIVYSFNVIKLLTLSVDGSTGLCASWFLVEFALPPTKSDVRALILVFLFVAIALPRSSKALALSFSSFTQQGNANSICCTNCKEICSNETNDIANTAIQ